MTTRVVVSPDALAELRERVAKEPLPAGVLILGPMGPNSRMAESAEEARDLEIAYGPAPTWVVQIIDSRSLERLATNPYFSLMEIDGLRLAVGGAKLGASLRVDLCGESIRVTEH